MKPLPLETQALVRTKLEAKNLGSQPQKKKNTQEKKQSAAKNKGTKNAKMCIRDRGTPFASSGPRTANARARAAFISPDPPGLY